VLNTAVPCMWLHVPLLSTAAWSLWFLPLTGHGVCHRRSPGEQFLADRKCYAVWSAIASYSQLS